MCSAVPYAFAAKYAYPDRLVIASIGDGAMQMIGINALIDVARRWRRGPIRARRARAQQPRPQLRHLGAAGPVGRPKVPRQSGDPGLRVRPVRRAARPRRLARRRARRRGGRMGRRRSPPTALSCWKPSPTRRCPRCPRNQCPSRHATSPPPSSRVSPRACRSPSNRCELSSPSCSTGDEPDGNRGNARSAARRNVKAQPGRRTTQEDDHQSSPSRPGCSAPWLLALGPLESPARVAGMSLASSCRVRNTDPRAGQARAAERAGFHAVWISDHYHTGTTSRPIRRRPFASVAPRIDVGASRRHRYTSGMSAS